MALDGSAASERALEVATSLAHDLSGELVLLTIEDEVLLPGGGGDENLKRLVDRWQARLAGLST